MHESINRCQRHGWIGEHFVMLRAARAAGIGTLFAVRHSDTTRAPREHEEFPAVDRVAELLPG